MVDRIIGKSIEFHGTWENWINLDTLKYRKKTVLWLPTGEIEREIIQTHTYALHPFNFGRILWNQGDTLLEIQFDGEHTKRFLNGIEDKNSEDKDLNTMLGAQYVMCMPFKLVEPKADFQYLGIDTLSGNREVHVIEVQYQEEKENHPWRYYFDTETYQLLANRVEIHDQFSLIQNTDTTRSHELLLNAERTSHFVDEELNEKYLRAEYWNTILD